MAAEQYIISLHFEPTTLCKANKFHTSLVCYITS